MEVDGKVGWKQANGRAGLTEQDRNERIKDHGPGPFTITEMNFIMQIDPIDDSWIQNVSCYTFAIVRVAIAYTPVSIRSITSQGCDSPNVGLGCGATTTRVCACVSHPINISTYVRGCICGCCGVKIFTISFVSKFGYMDVLLQWRCGHY